jgi:hypothetical protein
VIERKVDDKYGDDQEVAGKRVKLNAKTDKQGHQHVATRAKERRVRRSEVYVYDIADRTDVNNTV